MPLCSEINKLLSQLKIPKSPVLITEEMVLVTYDCIKDFVIKLSFSVLCHGCEFACAMVVNLPFGEHQY
jgi:hypothetical protein